ncbi:MAG: glycoside hydrolase family 127 protein [Bacteroidales bacterium]|nr:glycoside hydrolase family 127 protein [Bacteroidales bacterium]
MKKLVFILLVVLFACENEKNKTAGSYPITPVDFTQVQLLDGFWKDWVTTAMKATIPASFQKCEETGRINNFIYAGGLAEGKYEGKFGFNDSDVYKIIEGASYSLNLSHDPRMEAYLDTLIHYIAAAQEDDGYLYTPWTLKANEYNEFNCCSYAEEGQWVGTPGASHEFYNAGHMYEAAVAHFRATGKRSFLDVAIKNADLVYDVCITQGNNYVPGHQEIEIGLLKLYDVTGDKRYLELSKHLLDIRADHSSGEYSQAHLPVTEQSEAVGHAVRANYMYTAMADIAAFTKDPGYLNAVDRLWKNVAEKKLSVTGGVGASHEGEAYGDNYELPNHPYNETCASIANVYWNYRMFLLHGDSKYFDVLERTLYNGLISGLSLDGKLFFYPNTLEHDGKNPFNQGVNGRSPWFSCSCCPSNLSRFIPSVAGYAYAMKDEDIYVNLFMNSEVAFPLKKGTLNIQQETAYPWKGGIKLTVQNEKPVHARIRLRVPGWAEGKAVPSDLFLFTQFAGEAPAIFVNDEKIQSAVEDGYAVIEGKWKKGDMIRMELDMEVSLVEANRKVEAKKGLAAVQYGPLVYCAEGVDNEDLFSIAIDPADKYNVEYRPDLLGGVNMISSEGINLVPYYSWANREIGKMRVWFPLEK